MKIFVTMLFNNKMQVEELNLENSSTIAFEVFDEEICFDVKAKQNLLVVDVSEDLCLKNNGKINLNDTQKHFEIPLGIGFSLAYPMMDCKLSFDFDY